VTKIFIGGSRRISRLHDDVRCRLDRIVAQRLPVVVGDANGADKAVQTYFRERGYDLVEVFCAGGACRNNLGHWPVHAVSTNGKRHNFSFYASKDREMAEEASCGLMIWDGESKGTLMNVARLVHQGKPVDIYTIPNDLTQVRNTADWYALLSRCPVDLRTRIEHEWAAEARAGHFRAESRLGHDGADRDRFLEDVLQTPSGEQEVGEGGADAPGIRSALTATHDLAGTAAEPPPAAVTRSPL
jgi:hypothetical protein